jgi:hypothetical protein
MIDLNTLVKPGSTPLHLFFGNDINSRGEIAFYAFDQSNGEFHAAMGIPCDANHAGVEGCEELATDAGVVPMTSEHPKVTLPENVRQQLLQRRGFLTNGTLPAVDASQPAGRDFIRENWTVNLGSDATTNSCIPLENHCTSQSKCCPIGVCEFHRCCLPFHNEYCTKSSDCCSRLCVNNRCA